MRNKALSRLYIRRSKIKININKTKSTLEKYERLLLEINNDIFHIEKNKYHMSYEQAISKYKSRTQKEIKDNIHNRRFTILNHIPYEKIEAKKVYDSLTDYNKGWRTFRRDLLFLYNNKYINYYLIYEVKHIIIIKKLKEAK